MGENAKKSRSGDKDAKIREAIYPRLKAHLESGKLAITLLLDEEERDQIRDLCLLTNKPFIYAVNLSEDKILTSEDQLRGITGIESSAIPVLPVSAKMEMEMLEFSSEDRTAFLADYGVNTNPMDAIIKTCYDLLGLQYYFTAGETEVRAWTIKKGWKAPRAAGVIHTDFEKKFIKADTVNWKDLVDNGGWSKAREL